MQSKTELEQQILESVKKHEQLECDLANQLLQCKSELFDAQTFYQQFSIKVVQMMIKSNGKLVLKKNPNGEYVLELQFKGKKEVILLHEIEDICDNPKKENRIILTYQDKTKDIYTEDKERIITRIRELMQRCIRT